MNHVSAKIEKRNDNECWCECKEFDDWGSEKGKGVIGLKDKKGYKWNPSTCDCQCNEACKIDEYLDIKNYFCEKRLISKLILECKDEILNTTETLLNDKKVACAKSTCLIHTISLEIISCRLC